MLSTASLSLRLMPPSRESLKELRTYCWVIVEPPCCTLRLRTFWNIARRMPSGFTPSCW
jgi:hypothetical protein